MQVRATSSGLHSFPITILVGLATERRQRECSQRPSSVRSQRWRKPRTHRAAISASRIRCSARGRSSLPSPGRSPPTWSCSGPSPNSRRSSISSRRFVASSYSIKPASGCRPRSREFARWMIERPRSRPSWTPSASKRPSFSRRARAARPPSCSQRHDRSARGRWSSPARSHSCPPRGRTSNGMRPRCGRASSPNWVRPTHRRRSRSPASRSSAAPSARPGGPARHSSV